MRRYRRRHGSGSGTSRSDSSKFYLMSDIDVWWELPRESWK